MIMKTTARAIPRGKNWRLFGDDDIEAACRHAAGGGVAVYGHGIIAEDDAALLRHAEDVGMPAVDVPGDTHWVHLPDRWYVEAVRKCSRWEAVHA